MRCGLALGALAGWALAGGCPDTTGPDERGASGGRGTGGAGGGAGGAASIPSVDLGALPLIRSAALREVRDWAYQLQGRPELELTPLALSNFDLLVIDYSADGSADREFTAQQIDQLRSGRSPPRPVLAYMSIGEAEVGRFYWDDAWVRPDPDQDADGPFELTDAAPAFLVEPNPEFPDNFKVRYWLPEWQQIIVSNPGGSALIGDAPSYLDRIIQAGFDGVYLDIIDAFEFFGPEGSGEREDAAEQMVALVTRIARHAREVRGRTRFLVVPQNGAGIIEAAPSREAEYFAAIDAIGAEDTFYFGDADEDNPFDPQLKTISLLDEFRAAGLAVLAIDYVTRPAAVDDFYSRARARGWIPYASVRALNVLTVNPSQPPQP